MYLDRLAEELNDKLQEAGLISIAELCKNYDLPGDFLTEVSHTAASLYLHVFIWWEPLWYISVIFVFM